MKNETYIDDVRLIPGRVYPENGPLDIGELVGWDRDGMRMDEEQEEIDLAGYFYGDYFQGSGSYRRYLGPDEYGIEPVFTVEGPCGTRWPVAWQEHPEVTPAQFATAIERTNLQ